VIKSRRMREAGHIAGMGEIRNSSKTMVGRNERKRTHGRPRGRLKDNIKTHLK
jgi:hypothetical protein